MMSWLFMIFLKRKAMIEREDEMGSNDLLGYARCL